MTITYLPIDNECERQPMVVRKHPDALNNFFLNLPGGYRRFLHFDFEPIPSSVNASNYLRPRNPSSWIPREQQDSVDYHGPLYLDNTFAHFFRQIDAALTATNVRLDRIRALNLDALNRESSVMHLTRDYYPLIVPAYLRLRAQGYTHYDLTA